MEKWQYIREDLQYAIYLWIVHLHENNTLRMLYGFANPIEGQLPNNKWFNSTIESNKEIKTDIIRLSCFVNGKKLRIFADMLLNGDSLADISSKLDIGNIPESYKYLALIKKDYMKRPPLFLETKGSAAYLGHMARPIASLADNPMICEAIVDIVKEKLFETNGDIDQHKLMGMAKDALVSDLPLEIPGPDAERLGNFEVFSFPYESNMDSSPIKTKVIKEDEDNLKVRTVEVSIIPDKFKGNVFLRCRLRNGNVIIGDQVRLVQNASTAQRVLFHIHENCSDIETSVWDANEDQKKIISLLYEHRVPLMRTMHLTMGIKGMQGMLETQWTKKISNSNKGKSINNKFERVSRIYSEVGEYKDDPWVPAGRNIIKLFNDNFPGKSSASFFSKGWQDEDRFVKWLQEVTGTYRTHRVVLIDPYFDDEAISKFLALANYSDIAYEVITDVGFREKAAKQITEACIEMKYVIPNNIEIYGLTRVGGGTDQIFHDRFLVLFGESQLPNVYMLSNSISGVAKNFPSVVVPVPSDVACEIVEYYLELTKGSGVHDIPEVKADLLWPLEKKDSTHKELLRDESKVFPGFEELVDAISNSGTIPLDQNNENDKLQIAKDIKERIMQFDSIGCKLNGLFPEDESKALKLWCGIANWSVRIPDNDRYELFKWFNESKYKKVLINIAGLCIRKAAENHYPVGVLNMDYRANSISIAQQSLEPFSKLHQFADSLIEYHFENDHPSVYSVSVAFEYLLMYSPNMAFEALDNVIHSLNKVEELSTASKAPYYKIIATSLRVLASNLAISVLNSDFTIINTGLESGTAIIRAMCAAAIGYYLGMRDTPGKKCDFKIVIDAIDRLKDATERIHAFSRIAYDCQVLRNQSRDNSMVPDLMEYTKKKVIENWPRLDECNTLLRPILKNFSGPLEGGHSEDICDVLKRLIDNEIIQIQSAVDYIKTVICEKITSHLENKKSYYEDVDLPFTNDALLLLTTVAPDKCSDLIEEISRIINRAARKVIKPFSRTRDYKEWSDSIEVLCWCGIVLSNLYICKKNDLKRIENIFNDVYQTVIPYKDDINDNYRLLSNFLLRGKTAGLPKESRSEV